MVKWEQYDVRTCNHCYSTTITTPYQDESDIPFKCNNCGSDMCYQNTSDWSLDTWITILEYELQRANVPEWKWVPRQLASIFRDRGLNHSEIRTHMCEFAKCLSEIGVI